MQKQNSETTLEILSLLDKDEEDNIVDDIDENLEVAKKETISAVDRIGKTMAMCKTYEYILQCVPMAIGLGMVVFYTWKHCNKVGLQSTNSKPDTNSRPNTNRIYPAGSSPKYRDFDKME